MNYFLFFGFCLFTSSLFAEDIADVVELPEAKEELVFNLFNSSKEKPPAPEEENGYTINYNTVSIVEYIRFARKICNTNFIFNDQDLNFTVTVVSKEPITPENVMATLLQILRIHNLSIFEQEGSLVIYKNDDVKQLSKIVMEGGTEGGSSLVTRVFRLKNAKPESISPIIKSMISKAAMLETSVETRQLILTDITANVDKVATLIDSLDSAHTILSIRQFTAQFNAPEYLVEIAGQLMTPIAAGNPYHLVPANLSNNIYIVSTPELADRTIEILKTLDLPQKKMVAGERKLKAENIFVYKLENRTGSEILAGLNGIADSLEQTGIPDADLMETLETVKWIRETNSIMIVGSQTSLDKVKEFIAALDVASPEESQKISFFVYQPISRTTKEIYTAIEEMASNLQASSGSDQSLIATLQSAKINASTNTITFSGEERTFPRVKDLLATIDGNGKQPKMKNGFYVYKLNIVASSQFESSLKSFAKTLDKSNAADEGMVQAIEGMKYVKETNSYLFTGPEMALKRLQEVLPSFDGGTSIAASSQFVNYKPLNQKGPQLLSSLKDLTEHLKADRLADPMMIRSLESAKWVPSTGTILITGDPGSLKKIQDLIASLDGGTNNLATNNQFLNYKPQHQKGPQLLALLKETTEHLKADQFADPAMIRSLESAKWVPSTGTILITGDPDSLKKIQDLISPLDGGTNTLATNNQFLNYKPQHQKGPQLLSLLKETTEHLKADQFADPAMIRSLESAKWVPSAGMIFITGDPGSLKKIQDLLASLDSGTNSAASSQFLNYKPQHQKGSQLLASLKDMTENLKSDPFTDPAMIRSLESAKWVPSTGMILITGSPESLKKIQDLIASLDSGSNLAASNQFLNYKPVQLKGPQLVSSLKDLTEHFKSDRLADPAMIRSLESAKWVPSTNTVLITGDPDSLKKIQDLITTLDIATSAKSGYFIYKLQNAPGEEVEEDLEDLAKNFQSSGLKDIKILDIIKTMRYVKETNSILLTGDPTAIDEVKDLIAKYDYPRERAAQKSNFYMYKPQHLTATNIEKSLRDVGKSLTAAALADPSLLTSINSVKYVESTNSLIFTGPPDTLTKIDMLVKEIDVPPKKSAPIQHVGATTFLLYKLKNASGPQITASLRSMTADLKKSGTSDKAFVNALSSMKYVKETNSLMFTGEKEALEKVEALVERFDVTGFGAEKVSSLSPLPSSASNFFVYKPQSIAGPELEKLMHDFADNLRQSGLSDNDLFNAITSMRWVDKTQSLLFTGTPKALDQVKELLKDFDIPANLPSGPLSGGPLEPTIQAIDNTSFLVYKLQFHKGDEIQGALRQIAKDLIISNAPVNQNLLNSINSIQWLEVTNSLLCSGDQETLTRLRELIKNLDIPLKQVFIEILMIQTSLSNALTFGLEWGAQYQYRNKFAGQINNIAPSSASSSGGNSATSDPLLSGLSNVTPTKPPVPSDVNIIGPGFDLGVIGEVIRHGGDTYLSIGSLMAALQVDSETTIVMTPKILTQDGRTSTIFQGSNIPFAGSFISNSSTSAGANATIGTTNIEYRDIGVNLTITPVLGNSDIVTLDIELDQTQQVGNAQNQQITFNQNGLPSNLNGITTSKVTMQTTVHVPDDHFLILSGIVNNSNTKLKTGIPCLGSLPLIGAAFSQDNTSINNNSVVIFLRPHIIASLDDMRRITKHEETFFRDQTSTPFLENNYNESMELIKTIDDE